MLKRLTLDPQPVAGGTLGGGAIRGKLASLAGSSIGCILSIDRLRESYAAIPPTESPGQFLDRVLQDLGVRYTVVGDGLDIIPARGPMVVVANHPFGGLDGIILASILSSVRCDFKILANYILGAIPELRPLLLLVDPFQRKHSTLKNVPALKQAFDLLHNNGMLAVFPAGTVAHFSLRRGKVVEPPWNETLVRFIARSAAPVLPVFFKGRNSSLFQVAGLFHPLLRTALLPREVLNKGATEIRVKIGSPIDPRRIAALPGPSAVSAYLRHRTCRLGASITPAAKILPFPRKTAPRLFSAAAPAGAGDNAAMAREIQSLPKSQSLIESGEFEVFYARQVRYRTW